jgi:hypothetical protein
VLSRPAKLALTTVSFGGKVVLALAMVMITADAPVLVAALIKDFVRRWKEFEEPTQLPEEALRQAW